MNIVGGTREVTYHGVRALRPSGTLLLVGGYEPDFTNAPRDANPHTKEIDVRFVYGRGAGSRDAEWNLRGVQYPRRFVRWDAHSNLEALLSLQALGVVLTYGVGG